MNGTGTQTDPYQVTTADEFVTAVGGEGNYVKLMNDIDFNKGNYYNITSPIEIQCSEIDGQGYKLDNLLIINTDILFRIYHNSSNNIILNIKNIVFEILGLDIYKGYDIFRKDSAIDLDQIIFTDCDFRIKIKQYANEIKFFNFAYTKQTTFNNCIFNMEVTLNTDKNLIFFKSSCLGNYMKFNNCMINLDIYKNIKLSSGSLRELFWIYDKTYMNFCGIFINLYNNIEHDSTTRDYLHTLLLAYNNTSAYVYFNNSYIIAKNKGLYNSCIKISRSDYQSVNFINKCFYDSTLANGVFTDASFYSTKFLPLTTEQCKDAAYLESVGFIIST